MVAIIILQRVIFWRFDLILGVKSVGARLDYNLMAIIVILKGI